MKVQKVKKNMKKQNSSIDNLVVRCIIEEMGKNPLSFIPIINEIMSKNNPDNRVIIKNISEGLTKAAISQKDLVNSVHDRILDMIGEITSGQIIDIVNKQRISLSNDSKKFLEEVARTTMVSLCEKYFESKRKQIDQIFSDYFKTINNYIKEELNTTSEKVKREIAKVDEKTRVDISVPASLSDEVSKYVQFLQSKK